MSLSFSRFNIISRIALILIIILVLLGLQSQQCIAQEIAAGTPQLDNPAAKEKIKLETKLHLFSDQGFPLPNGYDHDPSGFLDNFREATLTEAQDIINGVDDPCEASVDLKLFFDSHQGEITTGKIVEKSVTFAATLTESYFLHLTGLSFFPKILAAVAINHELEIGWVKLGTDAYHEYSNWIAANEARVGFETFRNSRGWTKEQTDARLSKLRTEITVNYSKISDIKASAEKDLAAEYQKLIGQYGNEFNIPEAALQGYSNSIDKRNQQASGQIAELVDKVAELSIQEAILEQYREPIAMKTCDQALKKGLARVVKTNGGDPLINRGNISGRDPLGFLNCLCRSYGTIGVGSVYEPNPAGDCVWGNWGVNRGPLPTVSNFTNNSCAISYSITEMRTNKTPIQFVGAGTILKDGDQLQTTGKTVLMMPDGSELLVNPNSVVNFTSLRTGKVLVNVQQGSARILSAPGGSSNVEVQLGNKLIRPKGTEYTVQWDGKAGSVAVIEGSLNIANETIISNGTLSNGTKPEVSLEAGQQLETSTGKISSYNLSTDDGGLFVGLPLRELLFIDPNPQTYGTYVGAFADGKISEGWIWEDPGKDAKMETPETGTLKVTVPDGNELWGYPGFSVGQRTDAPRLLHKVTGDFDLEGELQLKSNGTDYAVTQFVLYAPGSNLGILADQMKTDGLGEDYWVGGGWAKQGGMNKLSSLNKDLKDCQNAPDSPLKLKITRHEDLLKTYWSLDGRQWNLSTRAELNISDTVWVGLVFKRMANDGLHSEPAVNTLKGVKLVTAPLGSMEVPEWDLVPGFGEALAENSSIRLALNGSALGDAAAYTGERFDGDLDAVVHFDTSNWTGQDGAFRDLRLFATNGDDKNYTYIDISQSGTEPQRYQTDLGINKGYGRYNWIKTSDLQGYLRIVRHNGNFSTYYWSECQWVPLGEFKTGFTDPVYIGANIANSYQATKPVPLAVDFNVEQILAGEAVTGNWTPTYCSLIQPVPLPTGISLPQGVEAKMFKPAFALGTIFFGPDGTAYAFSNEKGKQKLMAMDSSGTAHTYAESEILTGLNRKTGVMLGSSVLMTVDGWDGGNRYSGIYELNLNGTFSQWNLKSSYGGLGDIISAPDGGWYFSDFESDNIWHLPGRAAAEEPRITKGDRSSRIGLIQLAYDSADGTLYALDNYLDFRNAGTFRVCKITPDGEVVEVAKLNDTSKMNGGMALSSSGPFGHALYVSDAAAGKIFKVDGGTIKPVINGLIKPGEMQFNPQNGDLLAICDEGKSLLWVGSNLSGVGAGRSLGWQQGGSQGRPSGMANGSMQSRCHTDLVTGRITCVDLSNATSTQCTQNGTQYDMVCDKPPCLYCPEHLGDIAPDASDLIYEVFSPNSTSMNPPIPNTFTLETARTITCIATYHLPGYTPGRIGLQSSSGAVYGPWQAEGRTGMGGEPNCIWVAYINQLLPPGTYTITDSDQSIWSYDQSFCIASKGICLPKGICQVYAARLSAESPEKNVQGGCHKDPVTGQTICIDTTGDLSRQQGIAGQLSGSWKMAGHQTGFNDWEADLALNSDGTLGWTETKGANVGVTRTGTWQFDGTTFTMTWVSPGGGKTNWISNSVSENYLGDGKYTVENAPGGLWSAFRADNKSLKTAIPSKGEIEDSSKPTIGNLQPPDRSSTTYNLTMISADLADEGSGVNVSSVRISVDGTGVTKKATVIPTRVWYTPKEALASGRHHAQVTVEDNAGNLDEKSWSFTIYSKINQSAINTSQANLSKAVRSYPKSSESFPTNESNPSRVLNTTPQRNGPTMIIPNPSVPKVNNTSPATEPYTRLINGYVKYVGGNVVRIGVDVKLQEIFNGNIFDIGSAVSSRQDGSFKIMYSSDRLHNPDKPHLILQAFSGGKPFSDPMENIGDTNDRVELICSPHQAS
jgi:hypothetical protein